MLKDPEMLRRTMQAAADPAAMRSMLQQQDRMLFNILAQPGGANALKRMTREVGGGGGEGGSGFDALTEKMRLKHLSPEQDEEVQALARLRGEELQQVLERLPPGHLPAVRSRLFTYLLRFCVHLQALVVGRSLSCSYITLRGRDLASAPDFGCE